MSREHFPYRRLHRKWDPSWPECDRFLELIDQEHEHQPDFDAGESPDTITTDRRAAWMRAASERHQIARLLDDHVARREIVAQSKRPICDLVCDVVEKSDDHGDYIPDGAREAFLMLMHRHFGIGKPTPDPEPLRGPGIGAPTFMAI